MSLLSMIRKRSQKDFATATPATFATHAQFNPPTVARVATVAVANTEQGQSAKPSVSFVSSILAPIEKTTPSKNDDVFQAEITVDRNSSILPTIADTDDRHTCSQCLNLRGRVCAIAKPQAGSLVVANVGYRPQADTMHRCAGYLPNATDNDQRTGGERWPGLTNTKGTK
ncbi:MAG: hypothetical protein PHV02_14050 [Rhodocyclaceae bacterium]|nr:hypothetical protein [Rhodocyclaceae bacterium]